MIIDLDITNCVWTDAEHTLVRANVDGESRFIPVDAANRHYMEILRRELPIAEPS